MAFSWNEQGVQRACRGFAIGMTPLTRASCVCAVAVYARLAPSLFLLLFR